MLALNVADNAPLQNWCLREAGVYVVTTNPEFVRPRRATAALLLKKWPTDTPEGFGTIFVTDRVAVPNAPPFNTLRISRQLSYLADGDVLRLAPDGRVSVLFRRSAMFNAFLVTERCNNFCIMCSQPPREIDDAYQVDDLLRAIPLIDGAREICITGGEPTLLGDRFLDLVRAIKSYLPFTSVHILSNGRLFKSMELARQLASIRHCDLMIGIPLYSDISSHHDFVVQADGAYDETIEGILNLKRCGVRVEIRVVIHNHTYARLPDLAAFIARNLQFVDKVALMGMEVTGFAKSNYEDLWIDPADYSRQLRSAIDVLRGAAVNVSIYNHQLCTLDPAIRSFAVRSISDWKIEYLEVCKACDLRRECAGFFETSGGRRSAHIRAISLQ